ncbi:uncharacterized protein LOC133287263 isoform X1 [Gastrolobium bilobum]|uniref:uncharacterized protein LOC133287263 isoform X1 n=1 Tax=Gastrolobium bilobum TaxID=150636 RepID=UPI002AB23311|nr:uncharacterized protein LOC133287263 isoform X1 [Gastrolobium bilobum]
MEGVGARLGRSSTRYGPATVFTGPVRKWKKKWVHVSPSTASSNSNTNHNHNHSHNHTSNGNNGSHLVLYKWTPITQSQNTNANNTNGNGNTKDAAAAEPPPPTEEPPRRKFKYVPVALLEEQRNEAAENEGAEKVEDESKPMDADASAAEPTHKNETLDEKPDINDVPMEESQSQDKNQVVRQDLNESTLDLSLGLTSHDDEHDSDSKTNQTRDGQ